jgi:predicted MFS family arabinose efflux permease
MKQGVEGGHEEIPSRHPLHTLPFGAILTFVGAHRRHRPRHGGRATTVAEPAPAVADRRGLYVFFTAEGMSQVGMMMAIVAGPWFVLETTGSAARTGIVSAALAIGGVIPTLLGGPLVDRLGHKRASVLTDLGCAATIAAVPLLYRAGVLQFWQLALLVFLLASLNSNGDTARFGLVPFLADRAGMPIERANGADRAIIRLGMVLGPVLGGFLIAALGAANVLFVPTVTYTISALLIGVGVSGAANRAGQTEGGRSYLAELGEGLRFIRGHRVLFSMILIATVSNFLDKPLMAVILPVYAKAIYGSPTSLGLAIGAFGAGALTGSLVFGAIGHGWPRRVTFLSCWVLGALVIFGFLALTPPLGVLVIAGFVGGLLFGPINPIASTVIQEQTPPQLLGRVFGALTALAQAGIPIGAVLAGVVVQRAGLIPTIVGMGALYLLVPLAMFFNRSLRQMEPGRGRRAAGRAPAVE